MIPISRLNVGEEEAAAAAEVIRTGWIAQGKRSARFEEMVAEYVGAEHAVAANSCTTALHLALIAAGVKEGDEVICPSFSFIATANSIVYTGAKPVFVDIDPRTYNIDPSLIEEAITPRTTAIMPVSQIGLPANIPAILEIARKRDLKIVEDAAPALGSTIGDLRVGNGNLSDFTCFSFDARKILTTGEGGMITTNNGSAAERMRSMRANSASVSALARHTTTAVILERYRELGFNYKLTDIQAAMGIVQMGKLEDIVAERRRLAHRYRQLLASESRIELPYEPENVTHVYQSYCVRLLGDNKQVDIMTKMAKREIASRRITAIHMEPYYREQFPELSLPHTEMATSETLLLPMFVGLSDDEVEEIAGALMESLV